MRELPAGRDDVLTEDLGNEIVIYDTTEHHAHALQGEAATVWRALNGQHDLPQLAAVCGLSEPVTAAVLLRLDGLDLLAPNQDTPEPGVSRRDALRTLAKTGGAAILAAPLITTILIPPATASASTTCTITGTTCNVAYVGTTCTPGTELFDTCTGTAGCTCQSLGACVSGVPSVRVGTCG